MIHIDVKYIHLLSSRLDRFKKLRDYLYNFRCPYCGDSEKFKNKARGYFFRKADSMIYRCHNCDLGTTVSKVIQHIDTDLYKEYVKERWVGQDDEPEFVFEAPKFDKKDPKLKDLIPINKLQSDHPARQVLVDRQIPEDHYDKFFLCHKFCSWAEISSNKDHPRLVIPFYDEDGNVFAAQGRAFGKEQPKYLTVKFDDKPKIFGLERVDWSKKVYVVEGPIDSLFLSNALAVAGADFIHLPFNKEDIVVVLDNEPRSGEIVKKMTNLAEQDYSLVIWPETISQKDINDMTLAGVRDIEQIINDNTHSGLQARMRVASWKRI
jgi:transcription elongation factor Elf1